MGGTHADHEAGGISAPKDATSHLLWTRILQISVFLRTRITRNLSLYLYKTQVFPFFWLELSSLKWSEILDNRKHIGPPSQRKSTGIHYILKIIKKKKIIKSSWETPDQAQISVGRGKGYVHKGLAQGSHR